LEDIDPYAEVLFVISEAVFKPLTFPVIFSFVVMLVLVLFSALISGSEIAFFSLDPVQLKSLKTEKSKINNLILTLLEKPKRLLATILIANNFVNVGIVILSPISLPGWLTCKVIRYLHLPFRWW
jgi:CBS domain containing-hemolysin-like protein